MKLLRNIAACGLLVLGLGAAVAQEAAIRKNLAERLPSLPPIEEVSKAPMNGLYEIRVSGNEIFYTDAEGNFLIQGNLIDTKQRRNLTEERVDKLNAVAFDTLPLKDAFTIVRGNGKRKLAVFEDPNCGYCKRFERDMQKVSDVTVYMFLYPILSRDSAEKSRNIWCAKDQGKAWQDLMLRDQPVATASCDSSALARNIEFGKKYRITGTPTLIFADGTRVPGAISSQQLEKHLSDAKAP
ncbi:MAG: DsbC family protein [Pseudomonadota bacterium]|uniref:DsbC family protein n=1 Tax=Polaromonas sp. TaxID=1869339 RepID=UPI00179FD3F4|nr:DsbC family protein [Polaromonas sp.]MBA3595681.1 DsbC family protein [Polaromonas sp.]MDQ3270946.1 DsbC family protein [Pseudomonadota bacterium]